MGSAAEISVFVIGALVFLLTIAGIWKVFTKAGRSGWKAIIPIYNNYIMLRIGGHSGWWVLVFILPALPGVIGALTDVAQAQAPTTSLEAGINTGNATAALPAFLGGSGSVGVAMIIFALLGILFFLALFHLVLLVNVVMTYDLARSFGKGTAFTWGLMALPFVFWPILGFGDAQYRGPVAHPKTLSASESEQDNTAESETE